jgi:hypothetical protein
MRAMSTRGFRGLAWAASLVAVVLVGTACPKKEAELETSDAVAKADPPADSADGADARAADDGGDAEPTPQQADEGTGAQPAAEGAEPDAQPEDEGDDGGADESAAAEAGDAEPTGPDPKALLKTVVARKTKDDDAKKLLAEAEEAGATEREVAKAAVDRGLQLHATPDRAAAFFQWAADKDPKYPDPMWHLARQAAVEGDIDRAKELLGAVKERGGKKLLQQIDFDPMWEIIKDDPDVRKLL